MSEGNMLVDNDAALAEVAQWLSATPWLALSVELNATRSYRPRVWLLQLDIGGRVLAIDPLAFAGRRPDPVAAALGLFKGRVIVHGGEYALAALARELHVTFASVVDTQQAASLLGLPATGLRALCAELGLHVAPPQSIDWAQRPLSAEVVAHALGDVRHLHALSEALMVKIAAADLDEELAIASAPSPARALVLPDTPDPRRYHRIPGASGLPPEGMALLAALVRWRDLKAKELDVPPGRLLPNVQLIDLAHAPERALHRLAGMRFHSRLVHADLEALRRTVTLALAAEPDLGHTGGGDEVRARGPRKGTPTPVVRARIGRLKAWRRAEAEARGIGLQAVMPLVALEHLAFFPETPLAEVPALGRRRVERYASVIAPILRG